MGKKRLGFEYKTLTAKQKAVVLPLMVVVGAAAVGLAIFSIVGLPLLTGNSQRGIGADGFQAYVEKGTDLGVSQIVSKADVAAALTGKAKSVGDGSSSSVFNYNGDRGQTETFNFVRQDGRTASLYIDMTEFKSSDSMANEHILAGTGLAQIINGHSSYYMHAQTVGDQREYRLMVINDLTAYKLVIDQPVNKITISEVGAVASLIKLAQKANF